MGHLITVEASHLSTHTYTWYSWCSPSSLLLQSIPGSCPVLCLMAFLISLTLYSLPSGLIPANKTTNTSKYYFCKKELIWQWPHDKWSPAALSAPRMFIFCLKERAFSKYECSSRLRERVPCFSHSCPQNLCPSLLGQLNEPQYLFNSSVRSEICKFSHDIVTKSLDFI